MATKQGVRLDNISTHGKYILSSAFDEKEHDDFLNFLKVGYVDDEWYAKCVRSSNLVLGGSEDLYLELLLFVAENWNDFSDTSLVDTPLLKYFLDVSNRFFRPTSTQCEIYSHSKRQKIQDWLVKEGKVCCVSVYDYALQLSKVIGNDRKRAVTFVHFLHHSVLVSRKGGVLVPANGSHWVQLAGGSNPWRDEDYVELGEDYLYSGNYAGVVTHKNDLLKFLKSHAGASDIPDLPPPDAQIPSFFSLLTKENAFLLLKWIRNLKGHRRTMPNKFLNCIKNGSWLRVLLGGSVGCKPPSQSFLLTSSCECLLQNGSVLVDIPLVDQSFYGKEISNYKEELREAGVIWLRTSQGDRSPLESVLYDKEWKAASQICDIPFIDHDYYGSDIHSFRKELELLGVAVGFHGNYKLIADKLKSPSHCNRYQAAEAVLLLLECMRHLSSPDSLVRILKDSMLLKTNNGYKSPSDCYLFDPTWGCLVQVFNSFSLVDTQFYGESILLFGIEMAKIGVLVGFEEATKAFAHVFAQQAKLSSINKDNVLSFLACYKKLKDDVFIADDLCLKELFEKAASQPIFVWYPQISSPSLPRNKLLDIFYRKIGVRNLSESAEKKSNKQSAFEGTGANSREVFMERGLYKLILGFLADLQIEVEKRHEAVKGLLKVTVFETQTPITVEYSLPLKSGKVVNVDTIRLVRWEREKSEFYMHKLDKSGGHKKNVLECATYFAEVISEGLLWDKEDHIQDLAELIKLGFILKFDGAAIDFLMKMKNLQMFLEDEEFLSSAAFSSSND
ncbi:hypothetical protein OROHE_005678 [Orobanche hederae]